MNHNQEQRRRGHFHRGRRGPDRRGLDRRSQPPPAQPRDQVDIEQIMRDIRSRIAQRQGIDLSSQQIQDLAARKLESILDPRAIRPSLLESLRRGGPAAPGPAQTASSEPVYTFEDTTIYDSHRGVLRFIRRLFNPLLKLFFNPNPIIRALHLQAKLNVEAAAREADRERRQTEWNALHYEIVQRLVTEVSRVSLDAQALSARVESLNARVDFNDRRVRSIEGSPQAVRAAARPPEAAAASPVAEVVTTPEPAGDASAPEGARRRRRRRRGRRGSVGPAEGGPRLPPAPEAPTVVSESPSGGDIDREAAPPPAPDTSTEASPPVAIEAPLADTNRSEE